MAEPSLPFDPIAEARAQWLRYSWIDAADGVGVVTSVARANQIFLGRADAVLAPLRLTFARYELLMLLLFSRKGELPLGKISERLQVHAATVMHAVNRLQKDGFVRRVAHPTDGRTTLASITEDGEAAARRATDRLNREVFSQLPLTTREMNELFRILKKVRVWEGDFPAR